MRIIKRGDVFWAELPQENKTTENASVQSGRRPILVVSNDKNNEFAPTIVVAPLTSKVNKLDVNRFPMHVLLSNALKRESVILTEQLQTINKNLLLGNAIYSLTTEELNEVNKALSLQLGL